jgi:hypothetical protein
MGRYGGSVESGVAAETDGLAAQARPGLAQVALALARIMDNPRAVATQPAAARQLVAILGTFVKAGAAAREAGRRQVHDGQRPARRLAPPRREKNFRAVLRFFSALGAVLPRSDLLLAVYALHHRCVRVQLSPYRLAIAEGVHLGVFTCLVSNSHLTEHDDRVTVGEEAARLDRRRLLGQPAKELAEFTFAVVGAADRAIARLYPLDVVVVQPSQAQYVI